jgi:hypothetical protein
MIKARLEPKNKCLKTNNFREMPLHRKGMLIKVKHSGQPFQRKGDLLENIKTFKGILNN